jgi:hypothetical protein
MMEPQTIEPEITCPICDRDFAPAAMVWSEQNKQPLCPQCLAEEESCGCADD